MFTLLTRTSIRSILYFLAMLAILPTLVAILLNGWNEYNHSIERAKNYALTMAMSISRHQYQIERETDMFLSMILMSHQINSADKNVISTFFSDVVSRHNLYMSLFILDKDGNRTVTSRMDREAMNFSDRKYFLDAKTTGTFSVGEYTIGYAGSGKSIHYSIPIKTPSGTFNGVVAVPVSLHIFDSFFANISAPPGSRFLILDHAGIRLHRYPPQPESTLGEPALKLLVDAINASAEETSILEGENQAGDSLIYAMVRMRLKPGLKPYMAIVFGVPKPTLLGTMRDGLWSPVAVLVFFLLVSVSLANVIEKYTISDGLERLVKATKRIAAGDTTGGIKNIYGCQEVSHLGKAFDLMISRIRLRESEKRAAENQLAWQKNLLHSIIEEATDAIFVKNTQGRYLLANSEMLKIIGHPLDAVINHTDADLFPADVAAKFRDEDRLAVSSGRPRSQETILTTPFGVRTYHRTSGPLRDEHGRTIGIFVISHDITEILKVRELIVQTEKMMCVGGLAAGMAHEINNPLSGILQNVQVIIRRLTEDIPANIAAASHAGCTIDSVRRFMDQRSIVPSLEAIREAGERAARIVASMLEFSRPNQGVHPVNMPRLMDKTLELCATDYNLKKKFDFRRIAIGRDYAPDLPPVPCSSTQIQQVFMNILANAAQAMSDAVTPTILLRMTREDGSVRIDIEDNGPGIPEEVRKRVFEPFFTTKPVGEGTGLGLSVSYFIVVNNHRGTIDVRSTPGAGARFAITLPLEPTASAMAGDGAGNRRLPGAA